MRALAISAIILVAVIMGMSAVAPVVLQQAEARPGPPFLTPEVCAILDSLPNPSPGISHLLADHCQEIG